MILYRALVWNKIIEIKRVLQLQRLQRNMLLHVASAYRTVSPVARQVITRTALMDLQILKRTFLYNNRCNDMNAMKAQGENATMTTWQEGRDSDDVTGQ